MVSQYTNFPAEVPARAASSAACASRVVGDADSPYSGLFYDRQAHKGTNRSRNFLLPLKTENTSLACAKRYFLLVFHPQHNFQKGFSLRPPDSYLGEIGEILGPLPFSKKTRRTIFHNSSV